MRHYKQARKLADAWVDLQSGGTAAVVEQHTITLPYGWVFFWNSKDFIATGEFRHTLIGNAPIIVDKVDLELRCTGTARSIEHYVREYEATIPPARLQMTPEYPPGVEPTAPPWSRGDAKGREPAAVPEVSPVPRWQRLRKLLDGIRGRPTKR
jgi:Immunity protein 35